METLKTEVAVLGAGPGGYAAAFYAADKGKSVVLIDADKRLGGVCLNSGCIPSKALLHAVHTMEEAKASSTRGIHFEPPTIQLDELRAWKESILNRLGQGVRALADRRNITVLQGRGHFEDSQTLAVEHAKGVTHVHYEKAILATGSRPALPSEFNIGSKHVMTSTEALALENVPADLLIIGGGYIGMELGTVYAALGSKVVVAEALPSILAGVDSDLMRPVLRMAEQRFREVRCYTKVHGVTASGKKIKVSLQSTGDAKTELFDKVLVSVGRAPNSGDLGLEKTQVKLTDKGFAQIDAKQETTDPAIYAIGDVAGGPLLAHKAAKEARIAVDAILGEGKVMENIVIPSVIFTDPEIAWCGITEEQAKAKKIDVKVTRFSWAASGRAMTMDRTDGLTKLIVEAKNERILGMGIVGAGAGELIGEGVLAIEMGATARDLARSVHPHPTLSETLMESAEAFYGLATHAAARRDR